MGGSSDLDQMGTVRKAEMDRWPSSWLTGPYARTICTSFPCDKVYIQFIWYLNSVLQDFSSGGNAFKQITLLGKQEGTPAFTQSFWSILLYSYTILLDMHRFRNECGLLNSPPVSYKKKKTQAIQEMSECSSVRSIVFQPPLMRETGVW